MKKMTINVIEPYKTFLKSGTKIIEGRLAKEKYRNLEIGDQILLDETTFTIIDLRQYASFKEMLTTEDIHKVLPNISTIKEGIDIYRQFYSKYDETKYGVLAIELEPS